MRSMASSWKAQKSCRNTINKVRRPDQRGGRVHAMTVSWHTEHEPRSPNCTCTMALHNWERIRHGLLHAGLSERKAQGESVYLPKGMLCLCMTP